MVRCVSTFRSQVWWYQYTGGCQLWQQPVKELKNLKNSNNDFYLSLIQKIPKFVLDFVHYDRALDVILLKRLCIIHQLIFSLITYETITIALHYIRNIGWWLVLGWQVRPANTNELKGWNVANMHTTHSFITTNWTKCLSFCFSFSPTCACLVIFSFTRLALVSAVPVQCERHICVNVCASTVTVYGWVVFDNQQRHCVGCTMTMGIDELSVLHFILNVGSLRMVARLQGVW